MTLIAGSPRAAPAPARRFVTLARAAMDGGLRSRAGFATALGGVAGFWCLAAVQWPLRGLVVPWDSKNQFYAFFRFMASCLHEGVAPFWNPYHYAGHPSIADPQSLIFSPAFVLWGWLDPAPSLFAFDAMVFAHLLVGGLAIVAHGRRENWTKSAAVLAAMVFILGGAVSGRMNHTGILIAYGLFPLALLWLEKALDDRSLRAAAGLGFVAALIALGRSQVALLLCFVLAGLAIARFLGAGKIRRYALDRAGVVALALVVFLALISIPMLLTLQFADFSNRPEIGADLAYRSSLYPLNFANLLVPDVFGSLRPLATGNWGPGYFTRPDVDSTDRAFNYLFAGSFPALLLVWHGFAGGRAFRRGARGFAVVAIVAALYALGRYTPVFPIAFDYVPGIDLFRRPVGGAFVFNIALAYLCGALATDYAREGAPRVGAAAGALGLAVVASLLGWAVVFSAATGHGWEATRQIIGGAALFGALGLALALPRNPRARAAAAAVVVCFTAGELVHRNAASVLNAERSIYYAMLEKPDASARLVIDTIENDARRRGEAGARRRVEIAGLGGSWQNAAMIYGLEATNGYNPLRIGAYDRLVAPGETSYISIQRRFPGSFPGYGCLLGRLLGLEYIVLDRPIRDLPEVNLPIGAEPILAGPRIWIYRLANAAPRVTLESRVAVADASDFVREGRFPHAMDASEVLVDQDDRLARTYAGVGPGRAGSARIVAWSPDRVEIAVDAPTAAILTLHDPWYPGWTVEVDGVRKPLLKTDVLFRGVEIAPGARRVIFAYHPLSFENLAAAARVALRRHRRG